MPLTDVFEIPSPTAVTDAPNGPAHIGAANDVVDASLVALAGRWDVVDSRRVRASIADTNAFIITEQGTVSTGSNEAIAAAIYIDPADFEIPGVAMKAQAKVRGWAITEAYGGGGNELNIALRKIVTPPSTFSTEAAFLMMVLGSNTPHQDDTDPVDITAGWYFVRFQFPTSWGAGFVSYGYDLMTRLVPE